MTTVAAADSRSCVATMAAISSAETSGTSPESTSTVSDSSISGSAARTAPPVPSASGWWIDSTCSGSAPEMSRSGEVITAILPAPASRAARIGHDTSARPQTGWRTFGIADRIRVP